MFGISLCVRYLLDHWNIPGMPRLKLYSVSLRLMLGPDANRQD